MKNLNRIKIPIEVLDIDAPYPATLFGIECGPGWVKLYEPLIEECQRLDVRVHQIKEKFGGLRFYVGPAPDELYSKIDEAEERSFSICESCGNPGEVRSGGWIVTRCDSCYCSRGVR